MGNYVNHTLFEKAVFCFFFFVSVAHISRECKFNELIFYLESIHSLHNFMFYKVEMLFKKKNLSVLIGEKEQYLPATRSFLKWPQWQG